MSARNSAPSSRNKPAACTKARIRNSTECTGLRAVTTATAEATRVIANIQKKTSSPVMSAPARFRLSTELGVQFDVARDLALPAVAVGEQPLLVVEKLFARLRGEFEIRPL